MPHAKTNKQKRRIAGPRKVVGGMSPPEPSAIRGATAGAAFVQDRSGESRRTRKKEQWRTDCHHSGRPLLTNAQIVDAVRGGLPIEDTAAFYGVSIGYVRAVVKAADLRRVLDRADWTFLCAIIRQVIDKVPPLEIAMAHDVSVHDVKLLAGFWLLNVARNTADPWEWLRQWMIDNHPGACERPLNAPERELRGLTR